MTPKPGIQTTEFWLSAFTTLVSLLVVAGIPVGVSDTQLRTLAGAAAIVVPAIYSLGRALVKARTLPSRPDGGGGPPAPLRILAGEKHSG